ncbi:MULTISPECIES: DUF4136 domain-containing protein [Sphingomonadales]|uniref:DUF4136 domain-containing protein n=1 Tax=Edaphosphingomonas haloaromaticamans TaxID=653954 RepID=A0A1S1H942_9SPHN|nr:MULTISPECIES: DUF4136 domain-containing protein [Sphingomonas]AGH50303.1 putative lipoprotein [Sphingomonas sp. MM-1]MDX3885347.1 DUF4136 domain-containing protein [Sphingomonas sp.]OHT18644.1 hypothetical protein BHE75_00618 [Sphingomonas haloaromaticamans]
MAKRWFGIAALLVATACASTPRVNYDSDPTADFSRYRSYSWVFSGVPQGMNPLLFERVKASIDRSLAARSFTQSANGDFAIAFTLGARDRVEVTDYGPYGPFFPRFGYGWGGYHDVDVRNVTDGTLTIDIYDVATKKPVWHGTATQEINRNKPDPAMIDVAVDAALANFPPPPPKAR